MIRPLVKAILIGALIAFQELNATRGFPGNHRSTLLSSRRQSVHLVAKRSAVTWNGQGNVSSLMDAIEDLEFIIVEKLENPHHRLV